MNRRTLLGAAAAALLVGSGGPASALLIASDSFDYAFGGLNTRSGGMGWGGAWTAAPGAQVTDPAEPLSYDVQQGAVVSGGEGALRVTGNSNNLAYRPLRGPVDADEVYVSVLFQAPSGTIGNNDFASFWFDNAVTGEHTAVPGVGLKGNQATAEASRADLFARPRMTGEAYSENINGSRSTYFIVGRLWKSDPGSAYNHFDLWVNPGFGDFLSPETTSVEMTSLSSFSHVGVRTANLDGDDQILFDELRIGASWDDVVPAPVPEPASLLLLGSGLVGLAAFVRRRLP